MSAQTGLTGRSDLMDSHSPQRRTGPNLSLREVLHVIPAKQRQPVSCEGHCTATTVADQYLHQRQLTFLRHGYSETAEVVVNVTCCISIHEFLIGLVSEWHVATEHDVEDDAHAEHIGP